MPSRAMTGGGLARKAAAGAFWSVAQNLLTRVTAFVTVLILARLLSPSDFGVVAIASTLIPILQVVADLGITIYVLQHPAPTKLIYHTYFWISTSIALVGGAALFLTAPLIADLFGEPSAGPVMQGLAPTALLVTLGAVPQTILRRELRFKDVAVQSAIAAIISQAVAVTAAVAGLGVWALVLQTLTLQFLATLLAWIATRYKPAFQFSRSELRKMVGFGGNYVVSTGLQTAALLLVNFIITSTLGVAALGYLNIVQRLTRVVTDVVLSAVLQVSTVAFAMIRDSTERLRSGYLRSFSTMYTLLIPLMGFDRGLRTSPGALHVRRSVGCQHRARHDHRGNRRVPRPLARPRALRGCRPSPSVDAVRRSLLDPHRGGDLDRRLPRRAPVGGRGGAHRERPRDDHPVVRDGACPRSYPTGGRRPVPPGGTPRSGGCGGRVPLVAWLTGGLPDLAGVILVGLAVVAAYLPVFRLTARDTWTELLGLARHGAERVLRRGRATES